MGDWGEGMGQYSRVLVFLILSFGTRIESATSCHAFDSDQDSTTRRDDPRLNLLIAELVFVDL